MSVEKSYRCDLCRMSGDPKALIGLLWVSSPPNKIVESLSEMVEHHICKECATSIRIIMNAKTG